MKYKSFGKLFAAVLATADDVIQAKKETQLAASGYPLVRFTFLPQKPRQEQWHIFFSSVMYGSLLVGVPFMLLGFASDEWSLVVISMAVPVVFLILSTPAFLSRYNRFITAAGSGVFTNNHHAYLTQTHIDGKNASLHLHTSQISGITDIPNSVEIKLGLYDKPVYFLWKKVSVPYVVTFDTEPEKENFLSWAKERQIAVYSTY